MRFRMSLALLIAATSCQPDGGDFEADSLVGRPPRQFSTPDLWRGSGTDSLVVVERKSRSVQEFSLDPFQHQRTRRLPFADDDQTVVAHPDGNYYVAIADNQYAIVRSTGEVRKNPLDILGTIESVAYDPSRHRLVLTDEFQAMVLLKLSKKGRVTSKWKAGSLVKDKYVKAGAMLPGGQLVLSLDGTEIAVVDLKKTISTKSWSFESFPVKEASSLTWLSSLPGHDNLIFATDDDRVLIVNVKKQKITSNLELGSKTIYQKSRDYVPHVITGKSLSSSNGATTVRVVFPRDDGTLAERKIKTDPYQLTDSRLEPDKGRLTIVYDATTSYSKRYEADFYQPRTLYRFRLSDNLALDRSEIDENVHVVPTPKKIFLLYGSVLGKAELRGYGSTPERQVLKGYNLDIMRERYRNR